MSQSISVVKVESVKVVWNRKEKHGNEIQSWKRDANDYMCRECMPSEYDGKRKKKVVI